MRTWAKLISSVALTIGLLAATPLALGHGGGQWNHGWSPTRERIEHIHRYRFEHGARPGWHQGRWQRGWAHGQYGWWWVVGERWYLYPAPVYPYPYGRPTVIIQIPPVVIRY